MELTITKNDKTPNSEWCCSIWRLIWYEENKGKIGLLKINDLYSDETDDYIDNDANEELSRICTLPEELDFYGNFGLNASSIC